METIVTNKYPRTLIIKRALAFGIDVLFLGLVGFLLVSADEDLFLNIGTHGWWIGLVISTIYFGVADSRTFEGQSIGKRVLKIKVQKIDGNPLSVEEAILRCLTLSTIFYGSQIVNTVVDLMFGYSSPVVMIVAGSVIEAMAIGTFLVMLFHGQRLGYHDLLFKTVVVSKNAVEVPQRASSLKPILISVALAVTIIACQTWVTSYFKVPVFNYDNKILLGSDSPAEDLSISRNLIIKKGSKREFNVVSAYVPWTVYADNKECEQISRDIYEQVKKQNVSMDGEWKVRLRSGYDIGIFKSYKWRIYEF